MFSKKIHMVELHRDEPVNMYTVIMALLAEKFQIV